ncbi:hypothetical protein FISHEDRAFT_54913 [Fistulina hepatica ATCC 64428]|nr:hypothetical protein FISHEDRAFT_54913 [Fistulina hepatica ATCC 64428]
MRTLGGRIRNNAKCEEPWAPILEHIDQSFDQWQRTNPTINGKKLIAQWNTGGRTEFLAMVQGMPDGVEHRLEKRVQAFIWEMENKPQVGMKTLQMPKEQGGIGLIDIKARNEAQNLMWTKSYLKFSEDRPTWTYLADELILQATTSAAQVEDDTKINYFLQTWAVNTDRNSKLPEDLTQML